MNPDPSKTNEDLDQAQRSHKPLNHNEVNHWYEKLARISDIEQLLAAMGPNAEGRANLEAEKKSNEAFRDKFIEHDNK